jgi:antitoxin VapB
MEDAVPLNVKDEEAHALAHDLARETGETLTLAVKEALRERLERVRRQRRAKATAEELLAIGRRFSAGLKKHPVDHGALLYDERGLPK